VGIKPHPPTCRKAALPPKTRMRRLLKLLYWAFLPDFGGLDMGTPLFTSLNLCRRTLILILRPFFRGANHLYAYVGELCERRNRQ
jgi:hypothetical protein